ncbi:MAG: tRNA glutamyl-Q(34) synthetase GluQRS [Pirellulaceae bacterium]
MTAAHSVVGRLAPSPTGALHLGNARSFLLAWLAARQAQGKIILRIEDIDSPRVKPWATTATLEDLRWLGLNWDAGPDTVDANSPYDIPLIQTQRLQRYRDVLDQLLKAGQIYKCTCTRKEVAAAASAPHETDFSALEGPIYPGTCRHAHRQPQIGQEFAYRWAFAAGLVTWRDAMYGLQSARPREQLGDFVIGRCSADGAVTPSYQLAVTVDDFDMGITQVVRGNDLIASTYRQLAILEFMQWTIPDYYHVPLIVGPDGRRLAKRHGDTRLSYFREHRIHPDAVIGYLAHSLGLSTKLSCCSVTSLIGQLDWTKLPTSPTVCDIEHVLPMLQELSDGYNSNGLSAC